MLTAFFVSVCFRKTFELTEECPLEQSLIERWWISHVVPNNYRCVVSYNLPGPASEFPHLNNNIHTTEWIVRENNNNKIQLCYIVRVLISPRKMYLCQVQSQRCVCNLSLDTGISRIGKHQERSN